jgi:Transposase domain (DUF772)/Transposase DDE domain
VIRYASAASPKRPPEAIVSVPRWAPESKTSKREDMLLKRLTRHRKLFGFLREHRRELFDDVFQDELATMYRDTGEGKEPVAPALMAMALLLQAYVDVSDAEAVELSVVDARWQMVLGVLGSDEPAFSQGAFQAFRERMIKHDMERRLLERTVELAQRTKAFDYKKLPKALRLAVDSRPLTGAGRVEDTVNLLGHAARKLLECAAALAHRKPADLAVELETPALVASSTKRGLDIDWNDPEQKARAIKLLAAQIDRLESWVRKQFAEDANEPPLVEHLETLAQLRGQDLEPDPQGGGPRIRRGVAEDRRVSVEDPEMRHGRKTKSRTFNGFKSHLGVDLDTDLVVACAITPANRPEAEALPGIQEDIARYRERNTIGEMHIDRGYVASENVIALHNRGVPVVAKPWHIRDGERFSKNDFVLDLGHMTILCPANQSQKITLGTTVHFPAEVCGSCKLRKFCTAAAKDRGRSVSIAADERLQKKLRLAIATPDGRERLRKRVAIEHRLAHHARKQGTRARYKGVRKNLFDARRHAATINLEAIQFANAA